MATVSCVAKYWCPCLLLLSVAGAQECAEPSKGYRQGWGERGSQGTGRGRGRPGTGNMAAARRGEARPSAACLPAVWGGAAAAPVSWVCEHSSPCRPLSACVSIDCSAPFLPFPSPSLPLLPVIPHPSTPPLSPPSPPFPQTGPQLSQACLFILSFCLCKCILQAGLRGGKKLV